MYPHVLQESVAAAGLHGTLRRFGTIHLIARRKKRGYGELDEASAVTLPYPCWHQRGFAERNPSPV